MQERTLLERIRDPGPEMVRKTSINFSILVDSILSNLHRLLNTRRGGVPISADFGIPEFGSVVYTMPDSLSEFQQAIKDAIEKFEPRLRHVRIRFVESEEDVLHLCFEVRAQLVAEGDRAVLSLKTLVDANGQVSLQE